MKNITINALVILFLLASCDSVSTDKIGKVKTEERLVKEYCKTSSDKNFFRASATIKHPDLGESEYEAVQFAKAQMAENISQKIKSVTDRYKKTRTINGKLGKLKKGGFHLAINTKASIIPIGINGAFKLKPKTTWKLTPCDIIVKIGKPIQVSVYDSLGINGLLEKVEQEIKILSGEI